MTQYNELITMVKLTKTMIRKMTPKETTRSPLPIDDWYEELLKDGAVSIDIYTTSKKKENKNGLKFSSVRIALIDPKYHVLDPKKRELIATAFNAAFYSLYKDESGDRKLLIVAGDKLAMFEDFDFTFLPLSQPLRASPSSRATKTTFKDVEDLTLKPDVAIDEVASASDDIEVKTKT